MSICVALTFCCLVESAGVLLARSAAAPCRPAGERSWSDSGLPLPSPSPRPVVVPRRPGECGRPGESPVDEMPKAFRICKETARQHPEE